MPAVEERVAGDAAALDAMLQGARTPFVIRGLVRHWPLVQAGLVSARAARAYLLERARPVPFSVSLGEPGKDGRLFYSADMEMNFREARGKLANIFGGMDANEGFAANVSTALLVCTASFHSLPVSTTHISVGSLLGIGWLNGKGRWGKVGEIVLSWLITLPCSGLLAALFSLLLSRLHSS